MSAAQISEATSEKYDEVGDLDDFSRVQMNTKINKLSSHISTNSAITDYDIGSIMDMRLNEQSYNELNGNNSPKK